MVEKTSNYFNTTVSPRELSPVLISNLFTVERRQNMLASCPSSLLRADGKPALLYRHVSDTELLELLENGKKDGYSGDDQDLQLRHFLNQFRLKKNDPKIIENLATIGFSDPSLVLNSVLDGDTHTFKEACKELSPELRAKLTVRGLLPACFFGYIPTSLIPFGVTRRYYLEMMIPPERWKLHDAEEIAVKDLVYDREMQVLVGEIAVYDITMVYEPGEIMRGKHQLINQNFDIPEDVSGYRQMEMIDHLRSQNKKKYLPRFFV